VPPNLWPPELVAEFEILSAHNIHFKIAEQTRRERQEGDVVGHAKGL